MIAEQTKRIKNQTKYSQRRKKKMKNFEIKGNKVINTSVNATNTFEIVEKVPSDYFIWNIGNNMGSDEYIPFCQKRYPQYPKSCEINAETLKAIKLPIEEVKILRRAAHEGVASKEQAEKAINSKRKGKRAEIKRAYAEKTIQIFNRITVA